MERVQYSLERTLASLHTLDSTKTFSREELRALTAQRASLESALVRRIANRDGSDYIAYVAFEDKIEKLRLIRTAKAEAQAQADRKGSKGKAKAALVGEEEAPVGGTKEQQARLRASYLARCMSIFERGVTKLKDSLPLWQAYLAWARARNMRIVVGRIFARVLNLHTAHIPLWIQAAGYELGTNFAANTARLLLQRAISLNTLPFAEVALPSTALNNEDETEEAEATRPKKKRRQTKQPTSAALTTISSVLDDQKRPIAFTLNLTPAERNMLRLWVEYARMELVFLERLRRRWAILGVGQNSNAVTVTTRAEGSSSQPQGISQRFVDAANKRSAADASITETVDTAKVVHLPGDDAEGVDEEAEDDVEQQNEEEALQSTDVPETDLSLPTTGATSIQTPARAAQEAIMTGGLLTPLINTAFTSVAPKLRLPLALGLIKLLRTFPLLDAEKTDSLEKGQFAIRAELGGRVLDAFSQSTTVVAASRPDSAKNGATRAILLAARPIFLDGPSPSSRWSKQTREQEREKNIKLREQGRLCPVADEEVDGLLVAAKEDLKARMQSQSHPAGLVVGGPSPGTGDDAPTHLVTLQIIDALIPLASASAASQALLPILLGQFVGNLFTCAQGAAAKGDARQGKATTSVSTISAAAYGLSLSPEDEEARFGALAAQSLKTILEARLPVKKAQTVQAQAEVRGSEDIDQAEAHREEDDEGGEEAEKKEGQPLVQEANLRTLLETAIRRFETAK
ncbi:hypothetical protein A4X13_0g5319 [Tilletia indica]|uniref:U3 small nucleolar RNA-associated protein 6 N-terminal domain-containing protein n=1 Tax=Tilletia indica TaxID=43049 RepID=A0A177TMN5_9BASI|nr:hypothetical protein A4X13_0g5319 [Tilletia indica]